MRVLIVLAISILLPAAANAATKKVPRPQPDMRVANTTPQTNQGRVLSPSAASAVRVGAGRAVQEVLPYGRARALTGIVRPTPYGAAAVELLRPNTACAPAKESDCRRK